ncbi:MAG TPA: YnfA family protein, partial [Candidatus Udaeobacter sp.]|nr:YnfA family protein [Candidatus Udaeobacter sp.]
GPHWHQDHAPGLRQGLAPAHRQPLPRVGALLSSVALFLLAGLAEIGGGYLVWLWWREGRPWPLGLVGAVVLVLYGLIPTYQAAHFGRVYAAYGGVFVVLSLLWGWTIDRVSPDRYDLAGVCLCLAGVAVIMYAPRAA